MVKKQLHILQVGNVLVSPDIFTENFCCDLAQCKGQCCVEGDAGAPITMEEEIEIDDCVDEVWNDLSASAQSVIDLHGVAYVDKEGDLVTSIVNGRDCVFTFYDDLTDNDSGNVIHNCCLCALERACRNGRTKFMKPISCALYPIRVKDFGNDLVGINYNRWSVCKAAVEKGNRLGIPVYKFLAAPLTTRFGKEWYDELCSIADELKEQGYL